MKIMLIESNQSLHNMLSNLLVSHHFEVISATSNHFLFDTIFEKNPNLIIINRQLNQLDGFFWCKEIRKQTTIPIIFLSTNNSLKEQITAMKAGADDFISVPFSTDLFNLKVQSMIRRTSQISQADNPFIISHNGLILNTENNTLATSNSSVDLSNNECQLLVMLFREHGKIVKRETLLRKLWKDERYVDNNTLTVNINRIRKKMKQLGVTYTIQTKVKQGYYIP